MALADILKAAGLDETKIKEIETEATAEAARIKAEADAALAAAQTERAGLKEWWEKEATPELNKIASERDAAAAEAAFYRTQAESAKKDGFIPKEAPGFQPPTDPNATPRDGQTGRFVAGKNEVPGSPQYLTADLAMQALTTTAELMGEHQYLFGEPLRNFSELTAEAQRQSGLGRRVTAREVWEQKYKVADRRQAMEAAAKKTAEDAIRKDERERVEREYAERGGSNPNLRSGETSSFATIARAERASKDVPVWQRPTNERRKADREMARAIAAKDPLLKQRGTSTVQ